LYRSTQEALREVDISWANWLPARGRSAQRGPGHCRCYPAPGPRHSGRQTTGRLRGARQTRRNVSATRQTPRL